MERTVPSGSCKSASTRRLSAAGSATKLKDKALIDARPPLTRLSFSERPPATSIFDPPEPVHTSTPAPRKRKMSSDSDSADGKRRRSKKGDGSLLREITALIKGSEERMVGKIDEKIDVMTDKLTKRLDNAEKDVKKMGRNLKELKGEVVSLSSQVERDKESLPALVEKMVADKVAGMGRPQPRRQPSTDRRQSSEDKQDKYYEARRSLRIWPLMDLSEDVVRDFLVTKLGLSQARSEALDFRSKRLASSRRGDPEYQALVTFSDSRQRDEVKSCARNLVDRTVGVQMDPPDHLRSHYQTFQALAFQLKQKHPNLKRNVKFCDPEMDLEMDFNLGDGTWRTIGIQEARDALKEAKARNSKATKKDLADILAGRAQGSAGLISDSDSDDDSTMVEVSDDEENANKDDAKYNCISIITANARSLAPKIESLFDCISQRGTDVALITETWLSDGRQLDDLTTELEHAYSLSIISRSRNRAAANGRVYGGVAFVYRKSGQL